MPEGPEVRLIATSLHNRLVNRWITAVDIGDRCKDISNKHLLQQPLQVLGVTCHGKKMIWILSNNQQDALFMTSTLGLTGRWCWVPENNIHLTLTIDNQDKLYFVDALKYGNIALYPNYADLSKPLKQIGLDLLAYAIDVYESTHWCQPGTEITPNVYSKQIKRFPDKQVCKFLMEQKPFAGIGNYLKAEILYRSKIRPDRLISTLSDEDIERLRTTCLETIYLAFKYNGLTIKDYWDPDGNPGTFPIQVYKQKQDPLGNPVVAQTFSDGRTTHWVPNVQQ